MKKIISLLFLYVFNVAYAGSSIDIYQAKDNSLLLITTEEEARIVGWGSSLTSADCVFSALAQKKEKIYAGYLDSLDLNIVSYEIAKNETRNYPIIFNVDNENLFLQEIDVSNLCGVGINFYHKYKKITDSNLFNQDY